MVPAETQALFFTVGQREDEERQIRLFFASLRLLSFLFTPLKQVRYTLL